MPLVEVRCGGDVLAPQCPFTGKVPCQLKGLPTLAKPGHSSGGATLAFQPLRQQRGGGGGRALPPFSLCPVHLSELQRRGPHEEIRENTEDLNPVVSKGINETDKGIPNVLCRQGGYSLTRLPVRV